MTGTNADDDRGLDPVPDSEDPGEAARDDHGTGDRDEAPGERLDRQWTELMSELRVTKTGIQLLAGFLLTLPFQQRFAELSGYLRAVYLAAVVSATLATLVILAPIVSHRILFRAHLKDRLVAMSHTLARVGLALVGVAVTCVTTLTLGFLVGMAAGITAGVLTLLICLGLWVALPLVIGGRAPRSPSYSASPPARPGR